MAIDNEHAVIERIRTGDRNAYAILVERYSVPIFNLAFRMTGRYETAEDLSQQAFVRAYEGLESFDATRRFFPWLYTIALNGIRNHLGKRDPLLSLDVKGHRDQSAGSNSPELAVIERQGEENLKQCLEQLPLSLKEAVILRYYQDLAFDEIAEILDLSLSAAKMRVYRGLERLRTLLLEEQ